MAGTPLPAGARMTCVPAQPGGPTAIVIPVPAAEPAVRHLRLFAGQSAFDIVLAGCARFPGLVLYLDPQPALPFRALTAAITAAWPETPPYGGVFDDVVPHLTVATDVERETADEIEVDLAAQLPIAATIQEAWLYAPDNTRWTPRLQLPLARRSLVTCMSLDEAPGAGPVAATRPHHLRSRCAERDGCETSWSPAAAHLLGADETLCSRRAALARSSP